MKKIFATLAVSFASTTFAADFISVDIDKVEGLNGAKSSTAQYIRAGKALGDLQLGLQGRTARVDGGGLLNSLEVTTANNKLVLVGLKPFIGVGHDNGFNGAAGRSYQYGLVGATTGAQVGPGYALIGGKTRVGSTEDHSRTKQTVGFITYSIPVTKTVAVNVNVSKSWQDIKENAYGLGIGFKF